MASVVVVIVCAASLFALQRQHQQTQSVYHNRRTVIALGQLLSALQDAETGQRGYLLTGDTKYLDPYFNGAHAIGERVSELRTLVQGEQPAQRDRLDRLEALCAEKQDELAKTIALRQTAGLRAALNVVLTGQGRRVMDSARSVIAEMQGEESRLISIHTERAATTNDLTVAAVIGGSVLLLLIIGGNTLVIGRDLQLREQIAAALHASEERLSTTLTSIGDAVLATDATGRVTFMNPVAEELTQWSEAQARSRPAAQVFHIVNETTRAEVESPIDKVIQNGAIVGLGNHTLLLRRDGTECAIDDSGAPIRDRAGRLIGVILVFRDVTQQRRQERELLASHARVMDLNERLKRSMTETHHRVKNSLQIMSALLDLQASEPGDGPFDGTINLLKGQLDTLSTVHDLLTLESRAGGEARTLSAKQLLEKLLATDAEMAAPRAVTYDIADVSLSSKRATSLALVTNELVLNALKHGAGGVHIAFRVQDGEGLLEVLDEGAGIPPGFDPAEASRTGLVLIDNVTRYDLKGDVTFGNRTNRAGARIAVCFPLDSEGSRVRTRVPHSNEESTTRPG